jgi:CubicO group peptidase (beta-lactamase class C family)
VRALLLFALLAVAAPLAGMEPAAALRLSDARITAAEAYSLRCGGQALIVMQEGRTLRAAYAHGGAPARSVLVMSITKNLAALAIFAARADGLLSLDEPVSRTLPDWEGRRGKVTIRELLNQTSGLATGYEAIYRRGVRDKNKIAAGLSLSTEPGAQFRYAPGNYELLEEILRRKLARRGTTPLAYLTTRILDPVGVRPADWRRDRKGEPFFSAGARLTAPDLAKVGEFIRTRGRVWIVPVLPPGIFQEAFTGSRANSMYGLSFWLNANARRPGASPLSIEGTLGQVRSPEQWRSSSISSVAPPDLVTMAGSGGQRCYIVPSRKLVIVRFGIGSGFSDAEFLRRLFGSSSG